MPQIAQSAWRCPVCRRGVSNTDTHHRRVARVRLHGGCRLDCHLCGQDVTEDRSAVMHLGYPVHAACKAADLAEKTGRD